MEIKERTPVIYVPGYIQDAMMKSAGADRRETRRETIQTMLDIDCDYSSMRKWKRSAWDAIELGLVSSWNDEFVFVKYHSSLHRTGWGITAQATSREDLFERDILAEDRAFLDVPEYPGFDGRAHGYEAITDGGQPWRLMGGLMDDLNQDKRESLEAAMKMEGGLTELDRIAAIPLWKWVDDLCVFSRDEDGVYDEIIAEFNFDTWEWDKT